jgi:hypothetical protein
MYCYIRLRALPLIITRRSSESIQQAYRTHTSIGSKFTILSILICVLFCPFAGSASQSYFLDRLRLPRRLSYEGDFR